MFKSVVLLAVVAFGFAQDDTTSTDETITTLDLSNQGLTSLDDYDFSKYPSLEELDLSNNEIEHIKEDTFTRNTNLRKLNLSGNKQLVLPEFSTLIIANIEELNLSNCNIERLPANVLDGLIYLKRLDLSGNPLESKGIKLITITNLQSPETVILPHVDVLVIKEFCNELDITFEIKSDEGEKVIPCGDVRDGAWVPDEEPPSTNDEAAEEQNTEDVHTEDEDGQVDVEVQGNGGQDNEAENKEAQDNEAQGNKAQDNEAQGNEAQDNEAQDNVVQDNEAQDNEAQGNAAQDNEAQDNAALSTEVQDNQEGTNEEAQVNKPQTNQDPQTDNEPQPSDDQSETNTDPENNEEPQTTEASLTDNHEHETTTSSDPGTNLNAPDAIDGPQDKQENPPAPMQRGLLPSPPQQDPQPNPGNQKSEKMQENKDKHEEAKSAESSEASTGSNILVFLVIAVVVAGAAAFGYKFYKTRTYRPTNTEEPTERELKEIVVEKRMNGPSEKPQEEPVEQVPLMEKRKNSIEIKQADGGNEENRISAANSAVNRNASSPYVPTTTTQPPGN